MLHKDLYDVRQLSSLKDMLEQSEKLFGNKNAFLVKTENEVYKGISYSQFKSDVDSLGTALIDLGLKDKYIAVLSENRYEWCVTYFAAVNGTGIIVPLDKELPTAEIENLLRRSKVSAIVFSGKYADIILKAAANVETVKYLINMDSINNDEKTMAFKQLISIGKTLISSGDRSFIDAPINPEIMSILLFTSGTTDLAKGVMLSHKNICSNIISVRSMVYIGSDDSVLSILPLHHTYECTCGFLIFIYSGGTISFAEGLKHIPKNLKEVKPSVLVTVPLLLESMYKKIWHQAAKKKTTKLKLKIAISLSNIVFSFLKVDLRRKLFKPIHDNLGGNLRLIITGAAAIEPEVSKGFREFGLPVIQGYGLTECSPLVIGNSPILYRDKSIGLPIPSVEAKIDNADENGVGEIIVKGNNVMLGYFNNEAATLKSFNNGWFLTGDLGYVDKSGFFYITGRKKNVIVTKNGKNIFPEEVETYLNKSPYIAESLIWGKYDENTGETFVNAQIVPNLESILSTIKEKFKLNEATKELVFKIISDEVKIVNQNMPLYKRIRDFTIRGEEFAKTSTKKIKRYIESNVILKSQENEQ